MRDRLLLSALICAAILIGLPSAHAVPERALQPILDEKWANAASILIADETEQSDPATRLLLGYVALASNHTTDAMAMFASVQDLDGLRRWREWTGKLQRDNPNNRMAALLAIDASARLGEITAGTEAMQALLREQPNFALAYDLAGALAILRDDLGSARTAFEKASQIDPELADSWISRGALEAIARTPLDAPLLGDIRSADVLAYFDRGLSLDPGSAPARLGKGVILYGLGRFSDSATAFTGALRVAPWLNLAAYDRVQTEVSALRRYALQTESKAEPVAAGSTLQTQIEDARQLLDQRSTESHDLLVQTLGQMRNAAVPFDPSILDTASPAQLEKLVDTYGLRAVELATASRLDQNAATLFRQNSEIQRDVGRLSLLRNAWEATATFDAAAELGNVEAKLAVGLLRVIGAYAGAHLPDDPWAAHVAVSRTTAVDIAAVSGKSVSKALWAAPSLGEVSDALYRVTQLQSEQIERISAASMMSSSAALHNISILKQLSAGAFRSTGAQAPGPPRALLAPNSYAADPGTQAALLNAVTQSARGAAVVLVDREPLQTLLLQQELNRKGVVTQTTQTPQAGMSQARKIGAVWVIGADAGSADLPSARSADLVLKPPDIHPGCPSCGPPRSQPLPTTSGSGGWRPPPSAPAPGAVTQPPSGSFSGAADWRGFQRFTAPSVRPIGGVRTFKDAIIDTGRWPVHAPLTLCLPVVLVAKSPGVEGAH